jgi:hypothetical protein
MPADQLLLMLLIFGPLLAFVAVVGLWRLRRAPSPPADEDGDDEPGFPSEEGRDPRW